MMYWLLLVGAGLLEIGWPLGFKLASVYPKYFYPYLLFAVVSMGLSGLLLYLAQRQIPIGTAYVIWTGIGALGTALIGICFFQDSASVLRIFFLGLILAGIIGLKLVH